MQYISFEKVLIFYLILINCIGFTMVLVDKYRSVHKKWRIRERSIFLIAFLGGGIGVYCGMYLYKHKTSHKYFIWGIPAIIALQIICVYYVVINW